MKKLMIAAITVFGLAIAPAHAVTFVFKGDGLNVTPNGSEGVAWTQNCGTIGSDYCSVDAGAGLSYSLGGLDVTARAYADGVPTMIIQDVSPSDSGLGAFSEGEGSGDQTQFDLGESIEFMFSEAVRLTNVEFNAGDDDNCSSAPFPEGPCGDFELYIDDIFVGVIAAIDNIDFLGVGQKFLLVAITEGAGFSIAQFTTSEVPVPAALPLLLSGLAGLGFASRRKKQAA